MLITLQNLDLNYFEDANAQVDANFVICESGKIVEIQVTGDDWWNEDASMWKWMADAFNSCITHVEKKIDPTMISLGWKIYQNEFGSDEEQDDAQSKIVTQAGHSLSSEDGTLMPLAEVNNDDLQ